jgi:spore coat polysaccharide biosynthesis protein SpsF
MSHPRTVAIIQARMGSSRFPRKVLADLAGRPVIWHLITRLKRCKRVHEVVVATSHEPEDDDLARYVNGLGSRVVRGSESNVLQRLLKAARETAAQIIVRVTGDAPLVDPDSVDAEVEGIVNHVADFCIYEQGVPDINEGFEAFTMAALLKLESEAANDAVAQEHTCTYFKQHPDFVKTVHLPVREELRYKGARLSVDTPSDLRFLSTLHERLSAEAGMIEVRQVVQLLNREPELTAINVSVVQKAAHAKSRTAFIRCDASKEIGLGHLVRCLALADALRDEQGFGVTFVTRCSEIAAKMVAENGHRHIELKQSSDSWEQLEALLLSRKPDVLVLDVREDLPRTRLESLRDSTSLLVVDIDDVEEKRLACDLSFNPPAPQYAHLDWTGMRGRYFTGWEWVLLRRQFHVAHLQKTTALKAPTAQPRLLVTMGGSDPAGMTLKAARALREVRGDFHAIFVLGAAFHHEAAFAATMEEAPFSFEVRRSVADMASLMASVDAALACFSVTAYELAAIGVPAIFLSLSADHLESSNTFVGAGIGVSLGLHNEVEESHIASAVTEILVDNSRRLRMTQNALSLADGLGGTRIAEQIAQTLEPRTYLTIRKT